MAIWECRGCSTRYAVGLPRCPWCNSHEFIEEGSTVPKITVHGGPTNAAADAEAALVAEPESAPEATQDEVRTDYSAMSFKELRDTARDRGLPTGGTADELRARLEADDGTVDGEDKTHDQEELKDRLDEQEDDES